MEPFPDSNNHRRWLAIGYCLLLFVSFYKPAVAQKIIILDQAKSATDYKVTLSGRGFGQQCRHCQVIIEYSPTQRFTANTSAWSDRRISAVVPDINGSTNVKLTVQRPDGQSNTLRYVIPRIVVPVQELRRPVRPGRHKDLRIYEFNHNVTIGGKGEDRIDASSPPPACGATSSVFDHARVVYAKRRFGEAQIASLPEPGCTRCAPLKIRWYHEPTGRVRYQVHIYQRVVSGVCEALRQR